jgi:creatinase
MKTIIKMFLAMCLSVFLSQMAYAGQAGDGVKRLALQVSDNDPATLNKVLNVAAHEYGISILKPGVSCGEVTHQINAFFEDRGLLQYRTFGYGHSFGVLSHYYGREAGLELREDIDTVLKPGMVISMEPMLTIPDGQAGAGGYREHDILIITENGNENITGYPYGPEFNVVS